MIFLTAVWHIPSCRSQGAFSGRGDDHTTFFPGKVHEMQIIPQVAESSPSFPLDNSDHGDEGRDAQSKGGGWDKNEKFMVVLSIFYSRGHTEKIVLFIDLFIFQSFFWPHSKAYRILVPRQGMGAVPLCTGSTES